MRGGWGLAAALLAAALLAAGSGCESMRPQTVQIDAASGRFQSAQLTYALDTGRLSQPVQTARIEGQQVSYQQLPSTPLPDHSQARLLVQYPHPGNRAGYALAEVIIESDHRSAKTDDGAGKSGFQKFIGGLTETLNDILPGMTYNDGVREAWALDIPKEDLDQLVGHLAHSGYFQSGPAPTPGVDVLTRLDGKIIRKPWRQVPELDAFIERVRHEGKLVSYVSPRSGDSAPAEVAGGRNDSVAAYQQQVQRQQAQNGPPPQPYPIGNTLPPRSFGPPPQGPGYAGQSPAPNAWGPRMPPQGMPQQSINRQPPVPQQGWPQQGMPAPGMAQQPMPQQAAPYGNPPPQYGAAPPQGPAQSLPPGGGATYPNTSPAYPNTAPAYPTPSQAYRPAPQPVGPSAGAYPYVR